MPSFNAARLMAVARRSVPWLIGPAVLWLRGPTVELADPSACPAFLELVSIGALRARPDLHVGQWFDLLRVIVTTATLGLFVELVRRHTQKLAVAIATALAVGLSPLFPSALAPPWEIGAFGVCVAVALVATATEARSKPSSAVVALAVLMIAVFVPLSLLAGSFSSSTFGACAVPRVSPARMVAIVRGVGWWLGPFGMALAAFGAFTEIARREWRSLVMASAVAVAATALASGMPLSPAVAIAPLTVLLWWLAGAGLAELIAAIGRGPRAWIAAAVMVALVPALAASRRTTEERDDRVRPRGHDQLTLRRITTALNLVPQEAAFVEEDATTDVLLRAAVFGGRRKVKPISVIAPQADAVASALARHTVYAFPRRQDDLSLRGFVVDPDAMTRLSADDPRRLEGLAAITGRRSCQRLGARPADFTSASERIALSADSEEARGPAVIYLGGQAPGSPAPDGWTPRMLRGFGFFTFDQLTAAGTERLRAEAREAGLPLTHPILAEPFVVRLNLHRTPRAPLALAVRLGAQFPVGVVKLDERTLDDSADETERLTVCDAPPIPVAMLPAQN